MGVKEYLRKKKEAYDRYKARKDVEFQEREKNRRLDLKLRAEEAQVESKELEAMRKHQRAVDKYEKLKSETRPAGRLEKFAGGAKRFGERASKSIDIISSTSESLRPSKKGGDSMGFGNMFGGSSGGGGSNDLGFGDMFGGSPSSRKRRKRKGKRQKQKRGRR